MHPLRKQRLVVIVSILLCVGLATGLVLYALRANISLFYTPTQVQQGETQSQQLFRLGGLVKKGSVRHLKGLTVQFVLTDLKQQVTVEYTGLLPDLFREGQGIVAQGYLSSQGVFLAQEVLAKHDESYRPSYDRRTS